MVDFPDEDLIKVIRELFRDPDGALGMVGVGRAATAPVARKHRLDSTIPIVDRLKMYELDLRGQLELLAEQVPEFEGADLDRLEAEGVAMLVAMRELWRHFPELSA